MTHSSVLLDLSGSTFRNNTAGEEGYAVMSLGPLRSMDGLMFDANVQHCSVGTYGYEKTEVRLWGWCPTVANHLSAVAPAHLQGNIEFAP